MRYSFYLPIDAELNLPGFTAAAGAFMARFDTGKKLHAFPETNR